LISSTLGHVRSAAAFPSNFLRQLTDNLSRFVAIGEVFCNSAYEHDLVSLFRAKNNDPRFQLLFNLIGVFAQILGRISFQFTDEEPCTVDLLHTGDQVPGLFGQQFCLQRLYLFALLLLFFNKAFNLLL